jgi:uncharacterized iron-regulated membrane protein
MSWSRAHRYLALILVVPLIVWSVTGFLFHVKPGWSRAYDMLDAERPLETAQVTPISTIAAMFPDGVRHLELFGSAIGPLYRVTTGSGTALIDATTGSRRSPLTPSDARTLALDAISHSREKAGYGEITGTEAREDVVRFRFSKGVTVDVSRDDARISQRGSDTERIDWMYRIHYLKWTGNKTVDRVLSVFGLALIWLVMIPGLVLAWRRIRA